MKTGPTLPTSSRDSTWWGSPISVGLAVVLGGLGGGSVYWLAERSRVHEVTPADVAIVAMSAVDESARPADARDAPAATAPSAPAEPPPSAAEAPAAPEAEPEEEAPVAAEAKTKAHDEDEDEVAAVEAKSKSKSKSDDDEPEESGEAEDEEPSRLESKASAEKSMLQAARAKVRTGDTFGAQVVLEQMRQRFPDGALAQQRELLYIKTQKTLGALPAAKRSARAFAQAYPNSPYLGSLESLLLDP